MTTQFYQNSHNELFAIVEGWKSDVKFQRIIRNIETFGYSSRQVYELALVGFDNFREFNSSDYNGYNYFEVLDQLGIYTDEMRLIASISADCGSELYFEAMDESVKPMFLSMADWI